MGKSLLLDAYRAVLDVILCDPKSGHISWKHRDCASRKWNTRYAGQKAGTVNSAGYWVIDFKHAGKKYILLSHRVMWLHVYGLFPSGVIDHIDGVPTNNCISNLRDVSRSCNMRNAAMRRSNSSGVTGVFWRKDRKRWCARSKAICGKVVHLGLFESIHDARIAITGFRAGNGYTDRHGAKGNE